MGASEVTKENEADKSTYEVVQAQLKSVMERLIKAGHSVQEFAELASEKLGEELRPQLQAFLADVREGRVDVKGLTESARAAVRGRPVTPAQRESMIREQAWLLAEQRGFQGGSPEEDWYAAERLVDARLAAGGGLAAKGRKAIASTAEIAEEELTRVRQRVREWMDARGRAPAKAATTSKAAPKKAAVKKAAAKKAATKKATAKKAAKKTAATGTKPAGSGQAPGKPGGAGSRGKKELPA